MNEFDWMRERRRLKCMEHARREESDLDERLTDGFDMMDDDLLELVTDEDRRTDEERRNRW